MKISLEKITRFAVFPEIGSMSEEEFNRELETYRARRKAKQETLAAKKARTKVKDKAVKAKDPTKKPRKKLAKQAKTSL